MPIIVERFLIAKLVSVEKLSDMEYSEWKWREAFIRFHPHLQFMKAPQFLRAKDLLCLMIFLLTA